MNLINTIKFSNKIRLHALKMTSKAGTSHIGSMLSIADIIAVLFNDILQTKPFKKNKDHFIFTISANRFLRGMVRAIFGTLLEINENKKSLDDFKKIIEGKDRSLAGPSLPPHGLYLKEVKYNSDIYL